MLGTTFTGEFEDVEAIDAMIGTFVIRFVVGLQSDTGKSHCDSTIRVLSCMQSRYSSANPMPAGKVNEKNGWSVRIHVDGASGGFVAPFLYPALKWDFRLQNVASINASGHKWVERMYLGSMTWP